MLLPAPMISIIVAMAENRVIGVTNTLPWRLPEDLRHFRRLTTGHAVIMGRKNYESIGKPLPERRNIVLTRQPSYSASGCIVTHSPDEALSAAGDDPEIFVIGGADLYREFLPVADRLYLTLVHARIDGDTYFPHYEASEWRETGREEHSADDRHIHNYTFLTLERIRAIT